MKNTSDDDLTKLADAAFRRAALKAAEIAIQTGTPLIVWKNGALTEIYPKMKASKMQAVRKTKK